jgi:hypothetical protein
MRGVLRAVFVLAVGGCVATASAKQLTSRASFDLSCPSGTLRYKRIDERTQGVLGCGKRAIYVESCGGGEGTSCTWVLNGTIAVEPAAPEPAAPAPPSTTPDRAATPPTS